MYNTLAITALVLAIALPQALAEEKARVLQESI